MTIFSFIRVMMNVIAWNCRGAGRKSFLGLIKDLRIKYEASFVILLESHVSGRRAQDIIKRMGFDGHFVSDTQQHSGGI